MRPRKFWAKLFTLMKCNYLPAIAIRLTYCIVLFQFIVCEDGACGLNYEHSASEGIAVVQLIEHLLKYM